MFFLTNYTTRTYVKTSNIIIDKSKETDSALYLPKIYLLIVIFVSIFIKKKKKRFSETCLKHEAFIYEINYTRRNNARAK